jgi:hypothetical protein
VANHRLDRQFSEQDHDFRLVFGHRPEQVRPTKFHHLPGEFGLAWKTSSGISQDTIPVEVGLGPP